MFRKIAAFTIAIPPLAACGRSLAAKARGEAWAQSYNDCRRKDRAEGSASLSVCVLEGQNSSPARVASVPGFPVFAGCAGGLDADLLAGLQ